MQHHLLKSRSPTREDGRWSGHYSPHLSERRTTLSSYGKIRARVTRCGLKSSAGLIISIYQPPAGPPTPAIEDLHSQLTRVMAKEQSIFLLGDTNFDVTRPDKSGVTSYLQQLNDPSLKQLITEPTQLAPSPSLIDHLITDRQDPTADVRVQPYTISVHDLLIAASISVSVAKTRHRW